ncbi:MAG: hypothetical protein AUJ32_02160 [Parcubacteria group bacterium CG1_02_40_82]|uniref:Uncharacterized protein n=3 Tax=Candidatus Portnoyibacteriota TaxID=1817913 RepID=A0A2M7III3_9BACT|nr:MAG: hypothetical protein AUJ32_02160 [Parcubacteria group bacterium CG1_02_40_82]PIQ74910.1 MAG: hypothetical protein COV84_03995 [Candidatus Portnoybacteria bacterium CG11_big_fil_rev_8_21_14_0_20_40_15]PIW76315.1 MAG: hypothetical protein CO001_02010 [Candidatus Portnoybacteria bacterium CG_4_8_14_3_um_filter_40_10]PJA64686.1 MAG: hypothetical protein CO159_01705 [Candidatus Portnoybacteria bacterium CG_4_9_14_3_um_filter_40_10]
MRKKIFKYLAVSFIIGFLPIAALAKIDLTKDDLLTLLKNFQVWVEGAIFIIGILITLYAAFLYMTAGGDDEKISKAKKAFVWGLVGIGIAILATGIWGLVQSFLQP